MFSGCSVFILYVAPDSVHQRIQLQIISGLNDTLQNPTMVIVLWEASEHMIEYE